jgi:hypothetical protein
VFVIRSKLGQRFLGLFLLGLGGGFTAWSWYTALVQGYYYQKAVIFSPFPAVIGITLMLFPIDVDKFREKYGIETVEKFSQLPPEWMIAFVLAIIASLWNWFAFSRL